MIDALATGKPVADPTVRQGKTGKPFTTGRLGVALEDGERTVVSLIAFDASGERLALLKKGDAIAVVGRATLSAWAAKETGEPKAGLRLVVDSLLTPYQVQRRRKPAAEGAP